MRAGNIVFFDLKSVKFHFEISATFKNAKYISTNQSCFCATPLLKKLAISHYKNIDFHFIVKNFIKNKLKNTKLNYYKIAIRPTFSSSSK